MKKTDKKRWISRDGLGPILYECPLCGEKYQQGPSLYEGRKLNNCGGIFICSRCWEFNWDGFVDVEKLTILAKNSGQKEPPKQNQNGFVERW